MQVTGRDFESFKNVLQDSLVFFLFNFYTCSLETLQAHLTHSAKWKTIWSSNTFQMVQALIK